MLNKTLINWYCKENPTIKAEFTALKIVFKQVMTLRYDIKYFDMMIIRENLPVNLNKIVIDNLMNPNFQLQKWHNIFVKP